STSRSGSRYGGGSRRTTLTTVKMALVPPMPSASVSAQAAVKPGALAIRRSAKRTSLPHPSIAIAAGTAARISSLIAAAPPGASLGLVGRDAAGDELFRPAGDVGGELLLHLLLDGAPAKDETQERQEPHG